MSQSPIPPNTQRVMTSRGRAICSPPPEPPKAVDESDYFSDFDEEELEELNREVQRIYADKGQEEGTKLKEVQEDNPIGNDVEYTVSQEVARLPKTPSRNSSAHMVVEFEAETNTTQNTSYGGTDAPFSTTFVTYPDRKPLISYSA